MKKIGFIFALVAGTLPAQDVLSLAGAPPQEATVAFIAADAHSVRQSTPVKNAPYTADGENDFTQSLADGTRIQRKSSSKLARDSQGRTRTEHRNPGAGPMNVEIAPMVVIHDPVTNETIVLNEKEKTARKTKLPDMKWAHSGAAAAGVASGDVLIERNVEVRRHMKGPAGEAGVAVTAVAPGEPATFEAAVAAPAVPIMGNVMFFRGGKDAKRESLGKQTISGVACDGTRVTSTIAAGEIGNDRAIQIVSEEWFSPELQTMVMTKTNDPMHGENIYRLTNLKRTEPDKSLFEVPAGYTVKDDPGPMMLRSRERKP